MVFKMTKEVLLKLKGLQFSTQDNEDDLLETITAAEYYHKNDSHYIIYDEVTEGFRETTKNVIKVKENSVELTKRGLVNVHMIFEENRKNMTSYSTPYGDIMLAIDTTNVDCQESNDMIQINVGYALEVNYEHIADCKIEMDIRPKDKAASIWQ